VSAFHRWLRFNLVGLIGMAVQLTALSLFNRALHGHYLWATALALELTLLHNFAWHERITWRDRTTARRWQRLLRFHVSNGLISLGGNLLLTRVLVQEAHLPLLWTNSIAIAACSVANFLVSHHWAFAQSSSSLRVKPS